MKSRSNTLLLWSPRILAVLTCLMLAVFALDAFGNGRSWREALPGFAVHVAPALVMGFVAFVSWRWEWVGGVVFTVLALGYAYFAREHPSWVVCISAPLLILGVLFSWSWRRHGEIRAARHGSGG